MRIMTFQINLKYVAQLTGKLFGDFVIEYTSHTAFQVLACVSRKPGNFSCHFFGHDNSHCILHATTFLSMKLWYKMIISSLKDMLTALQNESFQSSLGRSHFDKRLFEAEEFSGLSKNCSHLMRTTLIRAFCKQFSKVSA